MGFSSNTLSLNIAKLHLQAQEQEEDIHVIVITSKLQAYSKLLKEGTTAGEREKDSERNIT